MDALTICRYLWLGWIAVWLVWALQSKRTQQRESLASRLSYAVFAWAAMDLMFLDNVRGAGWYTAIVPYRDSLGWIGIAITALGFAFTLWARLVLGGNWSGSVTIKVGHELVRRGPYRWVRHPIYTGMIVALIGTAIACDEWRGAASVVLLWLSFTIKRLKEEQFMRQTFGAQYDEYAERTGAIFPMLLRRDP